MYVVANSMSMTLFCNESIYNFQTWTYFSEKIYSINESVTSSYSRFGENVFGKIPSNSSNDGGVMY